MIFVCVYRLLSLPPFIVLGMNRSYFVSFSLTKTSFSFIRCPFVIFLINFQYYFSFYFSLFIYLYQCVPDIFFFTLTFFSLCYSSRIKSFYFMRYTFVSVNELRSIAPFVVLSSDYV